jgi:hypothetical protein
MSYCRCHVPVLLLEIVTFGAVRVVAEGVADGIGGGVVDGAGESEGSVLVKTPVGSVLSCPSCAGSQAPSGRAAIGVSPRVRR